jgi:hypothetical protein
MNGWIIRPRPVIANKTPKKRMEIVAKMPLIKKPHLHTK